MATLEQLSLKLKYLLVGLMFYWRYTPSALLYSWRRDWLNQQMQMSQTSEIETPGKLLQAEPTARGAAFYFENAELEICFLTQDLVQVNWKPGISPIPYGIHRHEWPQVEPYLEETATGWTLRTVPESEASPLQIEIGMNGSLQFCDASGTVLRSELPPQRQGEAWTHEATLQAEERIYGLGERAAPLNLRAPRTVRQRGTTVQQPRTYRMWNYDPAGKYGPGMDPLYLCIPLYLGLHSSGSYLMFYENSFPARFTFAETATAAFEGGALRYYFTAGTPPQLLERYTELTGHPPLPPRWALGYHQSRWGYETEAKVREVVQGFKQHDLPLSAMHLDIDVQVGHRAFTIDPRRFPKLSGFIQELALEGVQFISILNPGIKVSRANNLFLEGKILDAFCKLPDGQPTTAVVWPGWSAFPDFTNPLVRTWWSRQYEYLLDVGVAGFWHDMNEPAVLIAWGDHTLPNRARLHFMEGRGGDHREAHNVYGLLQARSAYESLCSYRPQQRPFIVSRSGWAGLQRYAWTWTGDVESSWGALRQTVATVVGLGLSGIPYSGPDIGGFQGNPSEELYLRWFQMASFLTFCRTHSSNVVKPRTPWTYGEPTLSITRNFLKLRYRLLPYFYTLAWEATQTGHPPVRPLLWADPADTSLWDVEDAFLLGNSLLVCPITQEKARSRTIRLPSEGWYHFWDDAVLQGPGEVSLDAPLERIPVLVSAGSILPMEEWQQLTLHLYPPLPGETHETHLYSDAGDGYGERRLEHFRLSRDQVGLELVWEQEGDYPFPYQGVQVQVHGAQIARAWLDGIEVDFQDNTLDGRQFHTLRLQGSFALQ